MLSKLLARSFCVEPKDARTRARVCVRVLVWARALVCVRARGSKMFISL